MLNMMRPAGLGKRLGRRSTSLAAVHALSKQSPCIPIHRRYPRTDLVSHRLRAVPSRDHRQTSSLAATCSIRTLWPDPQKLDLKIATAILSAGSAIPRGTQFVVSMYNLAERSSVRIPGYSRSCGDLLVALQSSTVRRVTGTQIALSGRLEYAGAPSWYDAPIRSGQCNLLTLRTPPGLHPERGAATILPSRPIGPVFLPKSRTTKGTEVAARKEVRWDVEIQDQVLLNRHVYGYETEIAFRKRIYEKAIMAIETRRFKSRAVFGKPTHALKRMVARKANDGTYHFHRQRCVPRDARRGWCPFAIRWRLNCLYLWVFGVLARIMRAFRRTDSAATENGPAASMPQPHFRTRFARFFQRVLRSDDGVALLPESWRTPWVAVEMYANLHSIRSSTGTTRKFIVTSFRENPT